MMNEPIQSVMSTKLITITPQDTLATVKEIFSSRRIHHLPVVEGKKLVGLITTMDLWRINKPFEEYGNVQVGDVMTKRLAYLTPEEKVGVAAELFLENRFHAVPIVNEEHELVGIITSFDIIRYEFRKEYPNQDI